MNGRSTGRRVLPCAPAALVAAAVLAILLAGCASSRARIHGEPLVLPELEVGEAPQYLSEGTLYNESGGVELVSDFRARHAGDVLVVRISEISLGKTSADSKLDKESSSKLETPVLFGYENQIGLGSDFDPSLVFQTGGSRSFEGEGETSRQNSLVARLAVRVLAVGSGGRMLVAGSKQITVNRESQRLVLAGIVRPSDVGPDNSIDSSKIAELTVTFGGEGDVAEVTRQGWFQRLLGKIWPF